MIPWRNTHLDRRPTTVGTVLTDSLGIYSTAPTVHLSLLARIPDYRPELLIEALERREAVRLRTLRGSSFLIPRGLVAVAQAATHRKNERAFGTYVRSRLRSATYEQWTERILRTLGDRAIPVADLTTELGAPDPDRTLMRTVISQMQTENLLASVPSGSGWRSLRYLVCRWNHWIPDLGPPWADEGEAAAALARLYIDAHGPITAADLAWWSGMGIRRSRGALETVAKVDPETGAYGESRSHEAPDVRLLPIWDTLLVTYRERSAFIAPEHHHLVYDSSGNATSVVLVGGRVAGIWDLWSAGEREVRVAPFTSFDSATWTAVAREVERITAMSGDRVTLIECAPPGPLTGTPQNTFMRPLRDARGRPV